VAIFKDIFGQWPRRSTTSANCALEALLLTYQSTACQYKYNCYVSKKKPISIFGLTDPEIKKNHC